MPSPHVFVTIVLGSLGTYPIFSKHITEYHFVLYAHSVFLEASNIICRPNATGLIILTK